jgi:hypothetical protein
MKNNERENDTANAADNVSSASLETKRDKQPKKTAKGANAPKSGKEKSFYQKWKEMPIGVTKILVYVTAIGSAVVAIGIVVTFCLGVWQTKQAKIIAKAQHRPRIILYRPPVLLEPFTTETKTGEIHVGKSQVWLKNVETGNAPVVYVVPGVWTIVPDKKSGDIERDSPPDVTNSCSGAPDPKAPRMFPMNAGEVRTVDINQSIAVTIPPFKQGEVVALYWPICTYYWDDDGDGHGTCLTYRFMLPDGQANFVFGASPLTGTFVETFMNYCQS